jgi:formate hydrogenlyase subunit 3/multisubunit Na+/H+ antiporter MnhD subunit
VSFVCVLCVVFLLVAVVCCRRTRDEWLTTLYGLSLGLVLQVLDASWFVLLQVKNKCERT